MVTTTSSLRLVLLCCMVLTKSCFGFTQQLGVLKRTASSNRVMQLHAAAKETVAVIGGGIAGLSCAQALSNNDNFAPTVFDTGRLRPGGRCASRLPNDLSKSEPYEYLDRAIVDHAAQILTVPPGYSDFQKQVDAWEAVGLVKRFEAGTVCEICNPFDKSTKTFDKTKLSVRPISKGNMYYGTKGMQSIPKAMMGNFAVEQDVWVSPSNGVKLVNGNGGKKWQVKAKGQVLGEFDRLVIAHNGKCADRLMSNTPAKDLHRLLQVNFAPYVPRHGGKRMTLNSIYSLSFAVQKDSSSLSKALPANRFVSGFVKNHLDIRFLSCNTRKYGGSDEENVEVWTVLSSAKFGKRYKGAQENLPDDLVEEVTGLLYESIEESLVLPKGSLRGPAEDTAGTGRVLESRLQLWGAGVPLNTWIPEDADAAGFLYDGDYKVGTCGDWLLDASIAGAWESGKRLAKFMAQENAKTAGLEGKFQASAAVDKAGIGSL